MAHAWLVQTGQNSKHDGQPWRDEIMRLSKILGSSVLAGKTHVRKVKQPDRTRKSVRAVDEGSLSQAEIASWPHSVGIKFRALFDTATGVR